MEISWQTQVDAYRNTAQRALNALLRSTPGDYFLDRVLDLLRTYVTMPRWREQPLAADPLVIELATTAYLYAQPRGRWNEILSIWPTLYSIATQLPNPDVPALLMMQQAIVYQNMGRVDHAQMLYERFLRDAALDQLSMELQVEILHQTSVGYLAQGKYHVAEQTLVYGLEISASHHAAFTQPQPKDSRGTRKTPLAAVWETRAYFFNLLGNLAWYRGGHREAERQYKQSLALFIENGEVDNLACVAYRGLGRLFVVEERYVEALPYLEKSYAISLRRQEPGGIANAAIYLAAARINLGACDAAETLLNDALTTLQQLEDTVGLVICHLYYGQWEACCGCADAAITQWEHALSLSRSASLPYEERQIVGALSLQYLKQGRLTESYQAWESLLEKLAKTQPLPHGHKSGPRLYHPMSHPMSQVRSHDRHRNYATLASTPA